MEQHELNFNSRAHVERDVHRHRTRQAVWNFNSRAHVERDQMGGASAHGRLRFQLTRSRGARQFAAAARAGFSNFNSRAHVERDKRKEL